MDNFLEKLSRMQENTANMVQKTFDSVSGEGGGNDGQKCCFCIPMKIGITIIGLLIIYDGGNAVF